MSAKRKYPFTSDFQLAEFGVDKVMKVRSTDNSSFELSSFAPVKQQCPSLLDRADIIYTAYNEKYQETMEIDHQTICNPEFGSKAFHELPSLSETSPQMTNLSKEFLLAESLYCNNNNNNNTPDTLACKRCLAGESGHFNHLDS